METMKAVATIVNDEDSEGQILIVKESSTVYAQKYSSCGSQMAVTGDCRMIILDKSKLDAAISTRVVIDTNGNAADGIEDITNVAALVKLGS